MVVRVLPLAAVWVAGDGAALVNVDAVIIAQQPRLAGHVEAMATTLEETLGVARGVVHVKATTTDRLGSIGRGEGIAAQAVALVEIPDPPR